MNAKSRLQVIAMTPVQFVEDAIRIGMAHGASDLHFERTGEGLTLRMRLDGILSLMGEMRETALADQTISRIKVLARLDISEQRIPQDGRMQIHRGSDGQWMVREIGVQNGEAIVQPVDIRVSIMPNLDGEDAVLRILDKSHIVGVGTQLGLDRLGFEKKVIESLRALIRSPHGMLLVTGPTGSGKTTTLYAALSELDHATEKTITIEDPIEYRLAGVLQIPVNEKKGLSFATGLRSVLRHDPDRILVGEIRDSDTADVAVQAALTGHQVLTTVHANSAVDVIGRFLHMGTDLYALASGLNGILAQRLVRRLCDDCKKPVTSSNSIEGTYRPGGCANCGDKGFKGRMALGELLVLDEHLREMIINREPGARIRDAARVNGFTTLGDSALLAVRNGETTLEEALKVDAGVGAYA